MKQFPVLLAVLLAYSLGAQSFLMKSLTPDDGLSHGYVSSLMQDSRGFVWIGTIYGLNRFDGSKVKAYLPNHMESTALHANIITGMAEDKNGLIWLGTDNGISVFHPVLERFIQLSKIKPSVAAGIWSRLIIDDENNIWCIRVSENGHKINRIRNDKRLKNYFLDKALNLKDLEIQSIDLPQDFGPQIRLFFKSEKNEAYLAGTHGTLYKINLKTTEISEVAKPYPIMLSGPEGSIPLYANHDFNDPMPLEKRYSVLKNPAGKAYFFNFFERQIFEVPKGAISSSSAEVQKFPVAATLDNAQSFARMIDNNGKIWVGTIGDGLRILEPVQTAFRHCFPEINFCNPAIMPDGKIWAGMYSPDKIIDLKTGLTTSPPWASAIPPSATVNSALYDAAVEAIFLVVRHAGDLLSFQRFDLNNGELQLLENLQNKTTDPVILKKDSKGNIWLAGAAGEVIRFQTKSRLTETWNTSRLLDSLEKHRGQVARSIAEDAKGRIWIAGDAGLTSISMLHGKPEFKAYSNASSKTAIFRNNLIFSIYPDSENPDQLWLGTLSGGLAKIDVSTEKIEYISAHSIQPFDVVTSIKPDALGNLWLSTNKGLFKYQPKSNTLADYSKLAHIPKVDVNAAGGLNIGSDVILFGGSNGMIAIEPARIKFSEADGNLYFTDIEINRKSAQQGFADQKMQFDDSNQLFLKLRYDDRFLALRISMPAAAYPEELLYRYKMKGILNDWIYLGQNRQIEFTELPPGKYNLEVQAMGPADSWENAKSRVLPVTVFPPWYAGKLAWFIYLLITVLLIIIVFKYKQNRLELKLTADFNKKEMERLQYMDEFKNRFFAYIAHEFKTPLTIIMGAGEKLRRSLKSEASREFPDAIIRESNNMLRLIHELIDVTRLQDKSIQPHFEHLDVVEFMRNVVESFRSLAALHKIQLQFDSDQDCLFMDMDPQRTHYILNNIISNAIRFTGTGGKVSLSAKIWDAEHVQIRISDNGQGIPAEKLTHIFQKYYSASEGKDAHHNFGLGLSFVRELTALLGCEIEVESEVGKGTTFLLTFPRVAPAGAQVMMNEVLLEGGYREVDNQSSPKAAADAPFLLIVEDNPHIQAYMKSILQPHFQIMLAKNGKEGLEMAIREIPDLILTDVMMPEMDGVEMTAKVKANMLTNHIPVLMLSAKNEIQDRIKGQENGADLYLGKPFYEQELVMALLNLHRLQQNWKLRYASLAAGEKTLEKVADMPACFNQFTIAQNDRFMQEILDAFAQNFASENFDAVELANTMNISKAQLYRKVSKISDEGVMGLLRNYRLMKAVEFLDDQPTISTKEVAFKVGFKEYSHFSASFKKLLQVSPTEWRKSRIAPRES